MEFGGGALGLDGLDTTAPCLLSSYSSSSSCAPLGLETEQPISQKGLFLKHGRPSGEQKEDNEEDEWSRSLKVARTEGMLQPAAEKADPFLLRSTPHSLFPDAGEQMLSFSSSSKSNALVMTSDGTLPFYQYNHCSPSSASAAAYFYRNAGMVSVGGTNVSMHGHGHRVRGPFTPSQWLELEHQALIYKYIDAKAPIPSNLLIPFRRSMISPTGLPAYFPGPNAYRSTALGWGSFHLGFSGSADPEPGRCRRTDGKKWRCSRDAVADQKYCERHINRGRHRSRKLVEGRSGQASKAVPAIAASQPASAGCSGVAPNGLHIAQQQTKSLQATAMDPSPSQFNRILMRKENVDDQIRDSQGLPALAGANPKPASSLFPTSKHHNPFEETSSGPDFGLVSADSLLYPSRNSCSENISFDSSLQLDDRHSHVHPLRHFIDDWPKTQTDRSPMAWPEVEDVKSDRTQLSISIPTDFSSSSDSPNQEKLALSPLRLSREFDAVTEGSHRQTSWIPISWEPTVGGPLGEVLNNTNNTPKGLSKNCSSSSLNLLTDGWDSSPILEASPTGVLQKTTFGSLSSSTGSSPRADNHRTHDSTRNMCDDLLGSTLVNASTIPSL